MVRGADSTPCLLLTFGAHTINTINRGLSEAESKVVSSFMDVGAGERRTLADIIMDKVY